MHICKVKISNILGIQELEFTPNGFTEVSGQNGTGKTSVLEAIKAALAGGHDASLLRKGADKGEIVLVLDDDTQIRKRVTEKASPLEVHQGGQKAARPTDILKTLTDMLSVNPIEFLTARKADRVKVLLEAMPIQVDSQKLLAISGVPSVAVNDGHGLAIIEAVRKQVFDDRTGTNRAVREKDATINQLRLAMPEALGGVEGSEDELRGQIEAAADVRDTELKRIGDKLADIKAKNQQDIDRLRAETQAKIDEIKSAAAFQVEQIQNAERDIETKAGAQRERTIQKHTDTVAPLAQALAVIVTNRDAQAKREQAKITIKTMEDDLEALQKDAARQTEALEAIDQYKCDLLAALPIPGVEIVDGEVYRDGVPFDRLNTAQQVGIAVEIAKLRAGALGVVCVDGLELLDGAAFEEFRKRTLASGLQLFVSRVSNEQFQVKTDTQ